MPAPGKHTVNRRRLRKGTKLAFGAQSWSVITAHPGIVSAMSDDGAILTTTEQVAVSRLA
jgi:hypothetical protein